MTTKIGVFYFSGTGNTELITQLIEATLIKNSVHVETYNIEKIMNDKQAVDMTQYDMIGIGHPIYGFGPPEIVERWVKQLPDSHSQTTFIYKTAADFITINHNASGKIIMKLQKKGYHIFYDRIICMGSNYLTEYTHALVKQMYAAASHKVEDMCQEILKEKNRLYHPSLPLRLLTNFLNLCEDRFLAHIFGKTLHVTDTCVNCGKCVNNCPSKNIYVKDGKIKFRWKCYLCMRCIYQCPTHAITSNIFSMFIVKQGYDIKKILAETTDEKDKTKYAEHFKAYLEDPSK